MMPAAFARREHDGERTGRSTLRRGITVVGLVVLIAAVVPFVVFAVPQTVGADHGFVILSGSMEPAVSPGDAVIVDASASVGVGDLVTFDDGNSVPTTHRVIGVEDGQYVTKGDANENADSRPVSPDAVLGRVTLVIPIIGHLVLWVNTPVGYVSLVLVPIGLLLITELVSWARADGTDKNGGEGNDGDASDGETDRSSPFRSIRPIDEEANVPPAAANSPTPRSGGIRSVDLKLTGLALSVLLGYAAWNVHGDVTGAGTPDPVSVAVLTGALLSLGSVGWIAVDGWLRRRRVERDATDGPGHAANGSADAESRTVATGGPDDGSSTEGKP